MTTQIWRDRMLAVLGRLGRHAGMVAVVLAVLTGAFYGIASWLLSDVAARKGETEVFLSEKIRHTVHIETLAAHWDGLHPGVRIGGLEILAPGSERPGIRLAEARVSLAIIPLLWGEKRINRLVLERPRLAIERTSDGRLRVSGLDAPDTDPAASNENFIAWLLLQRRLEVHDGEIVWTDQRASAPLNLTHVELSLRNSGDRHQLAMGAEFPKPVCSECQFTADIDGNPLADSDWDGEIHVRATGLDVTTLPLIVRERLPGELRGRFDLRVGSDWDNGAPERVYGHAEVAMFALPVPGMSLPLTAQLASGDIDWSTRRDGWRLDLAQLKLGLRGSPWSAGRVRLARAGEAYSLDAQHVNLDDVSAFVADWPSDNAARKWWTDIDPHGALDGLELRIGRAAGKVETFSVESDIARLRTRPHENIPGVAGLSGRLVATETGGELQVRSGPLTMDMPRLFRAPLEMRRAGAALAWEREADHWHVQATDLSVDAEDGKGSGDLNLVLPFNQARSPVLTLRIDFRDGNGAHAVRYYPAKVLRPDTLAWMESAFLGGQVVSGHLIYEGPIREWPFAHGPGRFELRAHVRGGSYRYLAGWAPVTHAQVDVAIDGGRVRVAGSGRIGDLVAHDVTVDVVPPTDSEPRTVHVRGETAGAFPEALRIVTEAMAAAPGGWKTYLPASFTAAGTGTLALTVRAPLGGSEKATFQGAYRPSQASLRFPAGYGLGIESANGEVRFSDQGLEGGRITGTFLGGPAAITAVRVGGQLEVRGHGRLQPLDWLRAQASPLASKISGVAPWSFTWRQFSGLGDLRAEFDLNALTTKLPAPLDRPDGLLKTKLVMQTESQQSDRHVLAVHGEPVRGRIELDRVRDLWQFRRGYVAFGAARPPASSSGLHVAAGMDRLDLENWLTLLAGDGSARAGDRSPSPTWLARVTADVGRLDLLNRDFGRVHADIAPTVDGWRATLDGEAAAGTVELSTIRAPAGRAVPYVRLGLVRLRLPEAQTKRATSTDPRRLPAIDIRSHVFEYQTKKLGELDFSAAPFDQGWRIARLNLTRPEMKLVASGTWQGAAEQSISTFKIDFDSSNMGQTMEAFGAPGQLRDGKVDVQARLSWQGAPAEPALPGLHGRVDIRADKGRFLELDPGAARLFGLLDLRSISRYLTFDFTSAFGKGFTFDRIRGAVTVDRGNASTDRFSIEGPNAAIVISGRAGLVAEDYDLAIEITPRVSDTLTLTSLGVLGPQAAVAVLALQRIFKKQIQKGTRITYSVTGPWEDPVVARRSIIPPVVTDTPLAE